VVLFFSWQAVKHFTAWAELFWPDPVSLQGISQALRLRCPIKIYTSTDLSTGYFKWYFVGIIAGFDTAG